MQVQVTLSWPCQSHVRILEYEFSILFTLSKGDYHIGLPSCNPSKIPSCLKWRKAIKINPTLVTCSDLDLFYNPRLFRLSNPRCLFVCTALLTSKTHVFGNAEMSLPGLGLAVPVEPESQPPTVHELDEGSEWRFEVAQGTHIEVKVIMGY